MTGVPRIIELRIDLEAVDAEHAILPRERDGPTTLQITPVESLISTPDGTRKQIKFRVEFEPDNSDRRKQPYREHLAPTFPDGWKIGDPWPPAAASSD